MGIRIAKRCKKRGWLAMDGVGWNCIGGWVALLSNKTSSRVAVHHFYASSSSSSFHHLQRIMDSAEQAALGDNDVQQSSSGEGFYDAREINQYAPDGRPVSGTKELLMRTLRRFDRMPVNLTHSTILRTTDTDLNGE